jgi:uncharacterized protein
MPTAHFRFYAELNDFLPPERRQTWFAQAFQGRVSIKHMVEDLGVPHTEVDVIRVNDRSVDFSYGVLDGDRIGVYPLSETPDLTPLIRLRPHPPRQVRFVLDIHLGKLATYLRLLGFDTLYQNDFADETLARLGADESRIVLTRDRGVLKRSLVIHGYCVRAADPKAQVKEVLERFDLAGSLAPFTRCLRCNGLLAPVDKAAILDQLPRRTREFYEDFYQCAGCKQVYWPGSHVEHMQDIVAGFHRPDRP